jgi:hypothetical protein
MQTDKRKVKIYVQTSETNSLGRVIGLIVSHLTFNIAYRTNKYKDRTITSESSRSLSQTIDHRSPTSIDSCMYERESVCACVSH